MCPALQKGTFNFRSSFKTDLGFSLSFFFLYRKLSCYALKKGYNPCHEKSSCYLLHYSWALFFNIWKERISRVKYLPTVPLIMNLAHQKPFYSCYAIFQLLSHSLTSRYKGSIKINASGNQRRTNHKTWSFNITEDSDASAKDQLTKMYM